VQLWSKQVNAKTIDMTAGPPLKNIVRFALPMMAGALFQQLYNIADMLIVGNILGSRALASIGVTGSATFFAMALATGLTTGYTAAASQSFGAKDTSALRASVSSTLYVAAVSAVLLSIAGFLGAEPLMRLLGTPDDIITDAVTYMRLCIGFSAGTVFFNAASSLLRAVGDSRTPLIFLIVASVLSALLDFLFILIFGMGVEGAAVATIIAQTLSAAACIVYMRKRFDIFKLKLPDLKPHMPTIKKILRIGLPVGFQSLLLAIGDVTITGVINSHGPDVVAAYATGWRITMFAMMFSMNLAMAHAVFAGQNLGAGSLDRIKQGFRDTILVMVALSFAMTAVIYIFGDALLLFFISSGDAHIDAVVPLARGYLRVSSAFYIFLGAIWLYNFTLRGIGDVAVPFISGLMELAAKIGLSISLSYIFGYFGIWFAMPVGWVLGVIPSAVRFHTGGWRKLAEGMG